jgi:nucleoside 2-deoxyribosyltransferase
MNSKCYIAAPFFTPGELTTVITLEKTLSTLFNVFSPRSLGPESVEDLQSKAIRASINQENLVQLQSSTVILAWLDRILPDNTQIFMETYAKPGGWVTTSRKKLNSKIDEGTLWEMGYAQGVGIPVVGFTLNELSDINIMLSENIQAVIHGWEELTEWVSLCKTANQYVPYPKHITTGTFR